MMTQQDQAREHRNREGELWLKPPDIKRSNQCTDNRSQRQYPLNSTVSNPGSRHYSGEIPANGAMAPKAVATPFPPLNPKKTGQMCPRQAAMAIKPSQKGLTPNSYAPQTGNIPFRTSKISTATAAPLPPIRNTLVAPDYRSRWFADRAAHTGGKPEWHWKWSRRGTR